MKTEQKFKSYILSQRFKYLALGLIAGYFIGITQEPYNYIFILVFVFLAIVLSLYFNKKSALPGDLPAGRQGYDGMSNLYILSQLGGFSHWNCRV